MMLTALASLLLLHLLALYLNFLVLFFAHPISMAYYTYRYTIKQSLSILAHNKTEWTNLQALITQPHTLSHRSIPVP